MKIITLKAIILSACLTWSGLAQAQNPSAIISKDINIANINSGVLEFENETIDYGTIKQNADGEKVFKFENKGQEPIIITRVKTSCGCTVPSWPKEPILPNETGEIKIKYDTKRVGAFQKTITVLSNASEPNKIIKIKGKILAQNAN
ncbi:MAG: DUF1573 domain-containing protein [Flavobacteriales bacterium]